MTGPSYGQPDGHGRYGIVERDGDGRLICHECGRGFHHLTTHVAQGHKIAPADYRERHGLAVSIPLISDHARENMRAGWERHASLHMSSLEGSRDPGTAWKSARPSSQWRPQVVAQKMATAAARRVDLTSAQIAELGDITDLAGWADRARALIARDGVPIAAIARAAGLAHATVAQRLRRYPPP